MTNTYAVYGWDRVEYFPYTVQGLADAALSFTEREWAVGISNPNRVEWSDDLGGTDSGLNDAELEYLEIVWSIVC